MNKVENPYVEVRIPTQKRALKTYNAILDASSSLIEREGIEGLNTNKVAKAAGVNVSTLYGYFRDKYSLIEGLLQRLNQQQLSMTEIELDKNADKNQRVERLIDGVVAIFSSMPWLLSLNDALLASPRLQEMRERILTNISEQIITKLDDIQQGPTFTGQRREAGIRLLLETYLGALRLIVKAPPEMKEQFTDELKRLVNSYLNNYR